TATASAGNGCAAGAVAPVATATTAPAARAARAEPMARRRRAGSTGSRSRLRLRPRVAMRGHGLPRMHAHARMERQQEIGRRPVGAMDGEGPGAQVGFGADRVTVARDQPLVVAAPAFRAARGAAARTVRLDECGTALIREAFSGGIADLPEVAVPA